jgi:hypothetical protein
MAVVDPGEAATSPLGRWALAHASPGIVPAALCLSTDDIAPIARMLGEEPLAMSRRTPEGRELSWRLAGLAGMLDGGHPFFIEWDCRPEDHPAAADAPHRVKPSGIVSVEIGAPSGPLAELASATPGVELASEPGVRSMVIGTVRGPVTL